MVTGRIDESSRRLAEFREGQPLVLRDGQAWQLRLPSLVVSPRIESGRVSGVRLGRGEVSDYDRSASVLLGDLRVDREEFWRVRFAVGCALLRANYYLEDDELVELLATRPGDKEDDGRWAVIEEVFLGLLPDPKPEDDASPSPA